MQNGIAFVFAGDAAEHVGAEAVQTDVDFVQACGAVPGKMFAQTVGVGGERDAADFGTGAAGGDNVGQVAAQSGFAAGQTDFARAAAGKGFD